MTTDTSHLRRTFVLLTLFWVGVSGSAMAKDFYRWTDVEGTTHYSEKPPKNASAVKVRASNTKMPADGYNPTAENPESPDEQPETGPESDSEPAAEKNSQRCEAARSNAKTLQEKSRIRVKDDNGEYRYLDSEEIAEKLKTALQILDEEC